MNMRKHHVSSITSHAQSAISQRKQCQETKNAETSKLLADKINSENFANIVTKQLFEAAFKEGRVISKKAYLSELNDKLKQKDCNLGEEFLKCLQQPFRRK